MNTIQFHVSRSNRRNAFGVSPKPASLEGSSQAVDLGNVDDHACVFVGPQSVIKEWPDHMRRHAELGEQGKRARESHLA